MRLRYLCLALLSFISSFSSFAASGPGAPVIQPFYNDTTISIADIPPAESPVGKKIGFFAKVKNKVIGFLVKTQSKETITGDKKKTTGWISVALLVGGLGIIFIGGPIIIGGLMMLAGLVTAIKAIGMKREISPTVEDSNVATTEKKRKTKWGLIIGVTLGVGALVALFKLANSWRFH